MSALSQARRLERLSNHLFNNVHLAEVSILSDLQILGGSSPGQAAMLVDWALSMYAPKVQVQMIYGKAFVYVQGGIDDHPETVWTVVPGLCEYLDVGEDSTRDAVELDVLAEFAVSEGQTA